MDDYPQWNPPEPPGDVPIPQWAPEATYQLPKELGGGRYDMPIITHLQQHGLSHEEVVGNLEAVYVVGNTFAMQAYDTFYNGFAGDVWSIQLTARPGYYVSPEVMQQLGWDDYEDDPNG